MIILDTHAVVWLTQLSRNLGPRAMNVCLAALEQGELSISAASVYELQWLDRRQRLNLPVPLDDYLGRLERLGILVLPISPMAARNGALLDLPHGDPIDRMIAGQSLESGALLVTADSDLILKLEERHVINARL